MTEHTEHTSFDVTRDGDGATRIAVVGQLLYSNRQLLKQLVMDALERGTRAFVLDLRQCGYIDSAGLGVIVSCSKKAEVAGATFRTEGLNEDLQTLFQLTRLDQFLTITPAVKP